MWHLTGFYGWLDTTQRNKSWVLLKHIRTLVEGPWVCIEDFNAILHAAEKLSKRPSQRSQVNAFKDTLDSCQLQDLGYHGYPYTWNNKRPGEANTKQRLNHAVATKDWVDKFQMSKPIHLSSHASDHLPILLQTQSYRHQRVRGNKGFKFEETWLLWEECEAVVEGAWNLGGADGFG